MKKELLTRAFIRSAVLQAAEANTTARAILEQIILGHFTSEALQSGKTIVASSAGGVNVNFALPDNFSTAQIMELAERALQIIEAMPDPDNPTFGTRRIKRLKVNFGNL